MFIVSNAHTSSKYEIYTLNAFLCRRWCLWVRSLITSETWFLKEKSYWPLILCIPFCFSGYVLHVISYSRSLCKFLHWLNIYFNCASLSLWGHIRLCMCWALKSWVILEMPSAASVTCRCLESSATLRIWYHSSSARLETNTYTGWHKNTPYKLH